MSATAAQPVVKIGHSSIDVVAIGNWAEAHLWMFLLIAAIGFVFFIFQKGGFAEKYLDYRVRKAELDAKKLDDVRRLADILERKFGREDPFLPFDKGNADQ